MAEVRPALSVQNLNALQKLGHPRGVLGINALDDVLGVYRRVKAKLHTAKYGQVKEGNKRRRDGREGGVREGGSGGGRVTVHEDA